MKKIWIAALAFSGLLIGPSTESTAQSVKMEKDYDRSFHAPAGSRFDLVNKYGEVIVRTWEMDSIRILVNVRAEGRTSEAVRKNIDKIDIAFRRVGSLISATTEVSSGRSGFFKELLADVDDYSKSIFGNGKLTVTYDIWMPEKVDLSIENKFGNVYLSSLSGEVSIDLAHGDLKADDLGEELSLKHSFGKSNIETLRNGTFILRGAELKLDRAEMVNIESSSSEIDLGTVAYVQFNSRNDKIVLGEAKDVIGEGVFTDFDSDMIRQSARLDFRYGDIYINRIERDFKSINILSESADINLILDQASYINTSIVGREDKMILPNRMLTMQKEERPEEGTIRLAGYVGNTQESFSDLNVKMDGGKLIIAIQELPLFSEKD